MSHNVTIGQIRRLMADGMGSLGMSRRDAHALGLVPKWFGEAGYTAGQRLANVGLTFEALKAAGLGLQSESHGVLQEDHMSPHTIRCPPGQDLKTWQAGFRESYKAQHGGRSITPVCTGKNCPTGLVPYTIPEGARAANIAAWTAELVSSLNGKADTDLFNMPNIGAAAGTGDGRHVEPGPPHVRRQRHEEVVLGLDARDVPVGLVHLRHVQRERVADVHDGLVVERFLKRLPENILSALGVGYGPEDAEQQVVADQRFAAGEEPETAFE
jgi:hypothetical protein